MSLKLVCDQRSGKMPLNRTNLKMFGFFFFNIYAIQMLNLKQEKKINFKLPQNQLG